MSARPSPPRALVLAALCGLVLAAGPARAQDRTFDNPTAHGELAPTGSAAVVVEPPAAQEPAEPEPAPPAPVAPAPQAPATPAPAPATTEGASPQQSPAAPNGATQEPPTEPAVAEQEGSPREAVRLYLEAARAGDYEAATEWLDLGLMGRRAAEQQGADLARQLHIVLDRNVWLELDKLSPVPEGHTADGLPAGIDHLASIPLGEERVDLQLARRRAADDPSRRVWKVSGQSVLAIPRLYERYGYGFWDSVLPRFPVLERKVLDVALFQWAGLAVLALLAWVVGWGLAYPFVRLMRHFVHRTATEADDRLAGLASAPLVATFSVLLVRAGSRALALPVFAQDLLDRVCDGLVLLTLTWLGLRLLDLFAEIVRERFVARGAFGAMTIVPLGRRLAKITLVFVAVLSVLSNLGYDLVTILAGLGVGGLAVALAAQKTFENFFGGISLIIDRPVQVGDFCKFGDQIGTIEAIGLRSTRVRTLDRTLITVPNAEFSQLQLENYAKRDQIRFVTVIGLRYETTAEQMRYVLVELKRLLVGHPKVYHDPARVRFIGFGATSLELEIFCYLKTTDWNEFLGMREDLLMLIMDVVERAGTGFAFPSQTVYLARDRGLDPERSEQAERSVAVLRESHELDLPNLPFDKERKLRGSVPWPPEGSSAPRET